MRKAYLLIAPALLAVFLFSSQVSATTRSISVTSRQGQNLYLYKDYFALVVGVSNYERWPRLPHAVDDAKEVASRLKVLGFQVKLALDPTFREMRSALTSMVYDMGMEADRAILFYYAGHGETEILADGTKMGYIIPMDCPLLRINPTGFSTHAISMRDIESVSLKIRSKHVLMVFDSCFSGSLFALVRAIPRDITEKSALPVRQYITAGREDEEVPDRSMFKRCFLIGLEGDADLTGDGYITGSELGMYLSDRVINYSHSRQHPQYGKINNPNLDRGDFVFASSQEAEVTVWRKDEEQRKALEEKRARKQELERLRQRIPGTKEKYKVQQNMEMEEKTFAGINKDTKSRTVPLVNLRNTPKELWKKDIKMMIYDHNFFVKDLNPIGDFINDFVDNGNGTITDRVTGLMWEKAATLKPMKYREAKTHIKNLNKKGYFGYTNWRLPTLEELCSLLRIDSIDVLHIHPFFGSGQAMTTFWSMDFTGDISNTGGETGNKISYVIDFKKGEICEAVAISVRPGYTGLHEERHLLKAVRNVRDHSNEQSQ